MWNKAIFAVFAVLTAGAVYLTLYDVGVQETSVERSVRQGSAGIGGARYRGK